jgi:carboxyl-terminal processing protease
MDRNGKIIRELYEKDIEKFLEDFEINENDIEEFVALAEKKGVKKNDEEFKIDADYLRAYLKSQVARNIWGNDGRFRVLLSTDVQFQKALTLFPEAQRIARLQ